MRPFTRAVRWILRRPLSSLTAAGAAAVIILELAQIAQGGLYEESLGGIDRTTLIELALLGLWGIVALHTRTDLQAVSFTLVCGLSFIFAYEAAYKWSFYMAPFRLKIPPDELRRLVIQIGTTLAITTGFAVGLFRLSRWTAVWMGLFVIVWVFWLQVGFPQITGQVIWPRAWPVELSDGATYLLNRLTKAILWLAHLSMFPALSKPENENPTDFV